MVDRARAAWKNGHTTSVLLMEIKAAFPSVAKGRLVNLIKVRQMDGDLIRWIESFLPLRTVEMIIEGNAMDRHAVEAGVLQSSPVSALRFAIYTSGLNKWVEDYVSEAKGLSSLNDFGRVATGSDLNHIVTMLERRAPNSIEWANRRGLQLDTAKMEVALFTRRQVDRKHLRPKLTAKIRVGNRIIRFNTQVTCWLGDWMEAHLTFNEMHIRCMEMCNSAEARLRTLTKTYGLVPESIRAIQMVCVTAVALYGTELWWDPREVGRQEDLQLLLNRQAKSIIGALPTTEQGALMRESGLPLAVVILDARQQRFTARLANTCSSKLRELHRNPTSGAPISKVIREEHEHRRTTEGTNWPPPGEESVVRTTILDDTTTAQSAAQCWAREMEAKVGAGVWMWCRE